MTRMHSSTDLKDNRENQRWKIHYILLQTIQSIPITQICIKSAPLAAGQLLVCLYGVWQSNPACFDLKASPKTPHAALNVFYNSLISHLQD